MTAFERKSFSVGMSGLDPKHCRHERVVKGLCRYCGAPVTELQQYARQTIDRVNAGGFVFLDDDARALMLERLERQVAPSP